MNQPFAVITTLNSKYIHSSLAPWCLLAGVKAYCGDNITANVVEGTVNEPLQQVAQRILQLRPRLVGLSCYIWNITATLKLVQFIKAELPQTVIVLGGPEVSYNAEQVLRQNPLVDYVIAGEGEYPFALLADALFYGRDPGCLPGLCYRNGAEVILAPPHTPQEQPPSPYTEEYFAALTGRIAYLETSRGCPYSCAFCLSGRCGGVRYFELEQAKAHLVRLANSGTRTIKLVDRTFNAHRQRAKELWRFIIDNYGGQLPKEVAFHFEVAGDILDEETITLLSTAPAGAIQLEVGLQSFNPDTLERIHRKTDVNRLTQNLRRVIGLGNMHIHIDLIAGLPGEDWASLAESFNTAYSLRPHMLQFGFLKLLHGAPMREQPELYPCQYAPQPPYEVRQTPWLTPQQLEQLHLLEEALERLYNSGRFRCTLDYLLEESGQTPFELFYHFGAWAAEQGLQSPSLDDYTQLVFDYFSRLPGVDPQQLRDVMVCDRLATNASGRLPRVLHIPDPRLKQLRLALDTHPETRRPEGVQRGLALLYAEKAVIYADYAQKHPVTGEYPLKRLALSEVLTTLHDNGEAPGFEPSPID